MLNVIKSRKEREIFKINYRYIRIKINAKRAED